MQTSESAKLREFECFKCCSSECQCESFQFSTSSQRRCTLCKHSIVLHAIDSRNWNFNLTNQSNIFKKLLSLVLYGCQAVPIRLKIVLDRFMHSLESAAVQLMLDPLGWLLEDFCRGYILMDQSGNVLNRWEMCSPKEEELIIRILQNYVTCNGFIAAQTQLNDHIVDRFANEDFLNGSSFVYGGSTSLCQTIGSNQTFDNHNSHSVLATDASALTETSVDCRSCMSSSTASSSVSNCFASHNNDDLFDEMPEDLSMKPKSNASYTSINSPFSPTPPLTIDTVSSTTKNTLRSHCSLDGQKQKSTNGRTRNSCGKNGKKPRVQCPKCEKYYCDKGALNIHIGAIHDKTQHKCFQDGCNMSFTTTRSRNRHSRNSRLHPYIPISPMTDCTISPPNRKRQRKNDRPIRCMAEDSSADGNDNDHHNVDNSDTNDATSLPKLLSRHPISGSSMMPELDNADHLLQHISSAAQQPLNLEKSATCDDMSSVVSGFDYISDEGYALDDRECNSVDELEEEEEEEEEEASTDSFKVMDAEKSTLMSDIVNASGIDAVQLDKVFSFFQNNPNITLMECHTSTGSFLFASNNQNPRLCTWPNCGKMFQNRFSVKTHFQNVHLRLPNKCTIDGCSAAFPSKRAQDRHSKNNELHKKLLSTRSRQSASQLLPTLPPVSSKRQRRCPSLSPNLLISSLNTSYNAETTAAAVSLPTSVVSPLSSKESGGIFQNLMSPILFSPNALSIAATWHAALSASLYNSRMATTVPASAVAQLNQNKNMQKYYGCTLQNQSSAQVK